MNDKNNSDRPTTSPNISYTRKGKALVAVGATALGVLIAAEGPGAINAALTPFDKGSLKHAKDMAEQRKQEHPNIIVSPAPQDGLDNAADTATTPETPAEAPVATPAQTTEPSAATEVSTVTTPQPTAGEQPNAQRNAIGGGLGYPPETGGTTAPR